MINFDVVVPAYNSEATIKKALESVISQSYKPKSIIIVVNGCNDKTEEIIDLFSKNIEIEIKKIVFNENIGLVSALNIAIDQCQSDWVARLDADDYWLKDHLKNLEEVIGISSDRFSLIAGTALTKIGDKLISDEIELDYISLKRALAWDNPIVHSSSAYKLESIKSIGKYREESFFQDYNLWIRLLDKFEGCIIKSDMCVHVKNNQSMTANMIKVDSLKERFLNQYQASLLFDFRDIRILFLLSLSFARVILNMLIYKTLKK